MVSDEPIGKIKEFKSKNNYRFIFAKTNDDLKSIIGAFPTSIILNKDKKIVFYQAGSFENLSAEDIKELLTEKTNKIKY